MPYTLKATAADGDLLTATFDPDHGMNLLSYKKGDKEIISQSTYPLFTERSAGLGALIGPHFHHRPLKQIPAIQDESRFPHIAKVKAKGVQEPFSHGIARYAPWRATFQENKVTAHISSKDQWQGSSLEDLEGQPFNMELKAELLQDGLKIDLKVNSLQPSIVGLHYYFDLPQSEGVVTAEVNPSVCLQGKFIPMPDSFQRSNEGFVSLPLKQIFDHGFTPVNPANACIALKTETYQLQVHYSAADEENSWQLFHPENAAFVCIEPLSAKNPRDIKRCESQISVRLQIV